MKQTNSIHPWVCRWLLIGLVMVFIQVMIGGITRLTDSGLSITEWEIVKGTIPPLNAEQWDIAFEAYKTAARKQYESLHADMTLSEFKWIYFWEYFHRLWARLMGLVFIIPFFLFWYRGMLPAWLRKSLGLVVLLAAAEATFGWIMVSSGLNDDTRTWVSTYKLMIHLVLATLIFAYLFWIYMRAKWPRGQQLIQGAPYRLSWIVFAVLVIQILFGGLMAGMRAAMMHPYFSVFIHADTFFSHLLNVDAINADAIQNYEPAIVIKTWVQLLHRLTAYVLAALAIKLALRSWRIPRLKRTATLMIVLVFLQIVLGIITVIGSVGEIPLHPALLHQLTALILLITLLRHIYLQKN